MLIQKRSLMEWDLRFLNLMRLPKKSKEWRCKSVEKFKTWIKSHKLLCTLFGIGSVVLASYTAKDYRERRSRTNPPTPKRISGERGIDRVDQSIRESVGDAIRRADENARKLEDYQLGARKSYDDAKITIGDLQGELERERNRTREAQSIIQRTREEIDRVNGYVERLGRIGRSAKGASNAIGDTVSDIGQQLDASAIRDRDFTNQFNAIRGTIGAIKRELSESAR